MNLVKTTKNADIIEELPKILKSFVEENNTTFDLFKQYENLYEKGANSK